MPSPEKSASRKLAFHAGPDSDKRGGLNGSTQHLLAVYLPESQIPKSFAGVDLNAVLPCRALLENSRTSRFSWENTVAAVRSCFRWCRAAKGSVDHRSTLSHS